MAVQSSVNIVIIQSMRIKEMNNSVIKIEPEQHLKIICDAIIGEYIYSGQKFKTNVHYILVYFFSPLCCGKYVVEIIMHF